MLKRLKYKKSDPILKTLSQRYAGNNQLAITCCRDIIWDSVSTQWAVRRVLQGRSLLHAMCKWRVEVKYRSYIIWNINIDRSPCIKQGGIDFFHRCFFKISN